MNYDDLGHSCGCGCHDSENKASKPTDLPDWAQAPGETLVCHCGQVSKSKIVEAIRLGAYTLPLVKTMTGAGRGNDCEAKNPLGRCCIPDIQELIRLYHQEPPQWQEWKPCCG
jgi:NAD(P)H-nitrite reductase large subunit